jgi:two-component system, OmpR family, sensor histidine kinase SenX3
MLRGAAGDVWRCCDGRGNRATMVGVYPVLVVTLVLAAVGAAGFVGWWAGRNRPSPSWVAKSSHDSAAEASDAEAKQLVAKVDRYERAFDVLPFGVVVGDGSTGRRNKTLAPTRSNDRLGVVLSAAIERQQKAPFTQDASGETVEFSGPPRRVFSVTAHVPEGSYQETVVVVEDLTERTHLESVRRDFVANISHELRTPVGALAVLAETLQDEPDPVVVERLSGRLVEEAHRVARVIDDLLELSALEGSKPLSAQRHDLGDLVVEAVDRVVPHANARDIRIAIDLPDDGPAAEVDRAQIVSAVANLVDNAVKFSEDGGEVMVNVTRADEQVVIEVVDRGVGIPLADRERIFERFYRVDKARSRATGGTGLGLAIVRHVVANHGGEIAVDSTAGIGSTFRMVIPVEQPD